MSKIKLLSIAVIGLLLINLTLGALLLFKKPPRPDWARDGEGPKKIIIERLHFDKTQIADYEILIKEHQTAIRQLRDSIRDEKNALYHLLTQGNATGQEALIAHLGLLQQQIERTHYEHFEAIKKICKPAQLADFDVLTQDLSAYFSPPKKDGPPQNK